ncbi:MAG: hypothetical protein Q7R39_18205 [Dehalococcoidia bacterium]|nr:hypothetical protein [Dehalococcoidia bacterium]
MGLLQREGKATLEELLEETDTSKDYLWRCIRQLEQVGYMHRVRNGHYALGTMGEQSQIAHDMAAWGTKRDKAIKEAAWAIAILLFITYILPKIIPYLKKIFAPKTDTQKPDAQAENSEPQPQPQT